MEERRKGERDGMDRRVKEEGADEGEKGKRREEKGDGDGDGGDMYLVARYFHAWKLRAERAVNLRMADQKRRYSEVQR